VELPLHTVFEAPTIAGLAERIRSCGSGNARITSPAPQILPVPRDKDLPLSFAQQRLWFLDQLAPNNPFYNMPAAIRLSSLLDVEALRWSLAEIVRRHEALRTTFLTVDGEPVQVMAPSLTLDLPLVDLQ